MILHKLTTSSASSYYVNFSWIFFSINVTFIWFCLLTIPDTRGVAEEVSEGFLRGTGPQLGVSQGGG